MEVVLIDDDPDVLASVGELLELANFSIRSLRSAERIFGELSSEHVAVIISDIRMPGIDGLSLLEKVLSVDADLPVILITGHGDVPMAVKAMKEGDRSTGSESRDDRSMGSESIDLRRQL